jgi:hypothetical protein
MPRLVGLCKATAPEHREAGFLVFSQLSMVFSESGDQHTQMLLELYASGLQDSGSVKVRFLFSLVVVVWVVFFGMARYDEIRFFPRMTRT